MVDPRWLAILKASGWQTTAIAVACATFLLVARWKWLPPLEPWMIQLAAFVLLISGCLAVASVAVAVLKFFSPQAWIVHYVNISRERRAALEYIDHMTPVEREIIGYLLAHNQKIFTAAADGGYAMPLISRGIVVRAVQPGQVFDMENAPMGIPDHIWNVFQRHKDKFPWTPTSEGHPWRVPWMLR